MGEVQTESITFTLKLPLELLPKQRRSWRELSVRQVERKKCLSVQAGGAKRWREPAERGMRSEEGREGGLEPDKLIKERAAL